MEEIDIFATDKDERVIVTVEELMNLYLLGWVDGNNDEHDEIPTVNGEIV